MHHLKVDNLHYNNLRSKESSALTNSPTHRNTNEILPFSFDDDEDCDLPFDSSNESTKIIVEGKKEKLLRKGGQYIEYVDPVDISLWENICTRLRKTFKLISKDHIYTYIYRESPLSEDIVEIVSIENIINRTETDENYMIFQSENKVKYYYVKDQLVSSSQCGQFIWDKCYNQNFYYVGFDGKNYGGWEGSVETGEYPLKRIKEFLDMEKTIDHFSHILPLEKRINTLSLKDLERQKFFYYKDGFIIYSIILDGNLCTLDVINEDKLIIQEGISLEKEKNNITYLKFKKYKVFKIIFPNLEEICDGEDGSSNINCRPIFNYVTDGNQIYGTYDSNLVIFNINKTVDIRNYVWPSSFKLFQGYEWCFTDVYSLPEDITGLCHLNLSLFIILFIIFMTS